MATTADPGQPLNVEGAVIDRYAQGAAQVQPALCCPTDGYDPKYLDVLPDEILEKDYGCGDPSKYVDDGDIVIDLGSGGGKICYILSQKVGPNGRVLGVDFNDAMLDLARRHQADIASKIGHDNVQFLKGRIQDLQLDLERAESWLQQHPVTTANDMIAMESECARLRSEEPLIAEGTADVVVSNCVLNLVRQEQKQQLFSEIFRVLKKGGRAVISDIVSDEFPTTAMQNDPELWSGCISGAFQEHEFLQMFADAGFYGIEVLERQAEPWQVVDGIEFRSLTVRAWKGKEGPCLERNQAVIYRGPFSQVKDDDGHTYYRGKRMAVCDKTFRILTADNSPYSAFFDPVEPLDDIPLDQALPFNCATNATRDPRQTKGQDYSETRLTNGDACGPDGCC